MLNYSSDYCWSADQEIEAANTSSLSRASSSALQAFTSPTAPTSVVMSSPGPVMSLGLQRWLASTLLDNPLDMPEWLSHIDNTQVTPYDITETGHYGLPASYILSDVSITVATCTTDIFVDLSPQVSAFGPSTNQTKPLLTDNVHQNIGFTRNKSVDHDREDFQTIHPTETPVIHPAFLKAFPDNIKLQLLANSIFNSSWFKSNDIEPRFCQDELKQYGLTSKEYSGSLFDRFFENTPKFKCRWMNGNQQCPHDTTRPGRARAHAYGHFGYNPFVCSGRCDELECVKRFTSNGALNDHIRRRRGPKKPCPNCSREVTIQNLSRHMKDMH